MIDVPRQDSPAYEESPLTWKPFTIYESGEIGGALLTCSRGHTCSLTIDKEHAHTIAADGTVSPSVVCPIEGCDFHEFVRLIGWEDLHG